MYINSLYYFIEVAKDLHITKTASRLFISQQTLSNHISRLEEYCGTSLLNRKPKLSLTYAGEVLLDYANKICRENTNLLDVLSDISKEEKGAIEFGASTLRMSSCLPSILPEFSAQFPNIEIRITDTNSKNLEDMVLSGDLDLAISITDAEHPSIQKTHLMYDQIYLCASNSLISKYYGKEAQKLKDISSQGADIKNFERLPFCLLNNRMGEKISRCFDYSGITPKVYATSSYIQISNSIGSQGLAAYFATRTSLLNQPESSNLDISIFPLTYKNEPLLQQIFIIQHKERYLTSYKQLFLNLIKEYFNKVEQLPIESIVNQNGIQSIK